MINCQICGNSHRKGQMRCELRVPKFCSECGELFLAHKLARFCSPACANKFNGREYYLSNRRQINGRYRRSSRLIECANCGKDFHNRGSGFFLYCSNACAKQSKRRRWRRYREKNRDKYNAKCRNWARQHPEKRGRYPSIVQRRVEAHARIEVRKQECDRHADIMEASRQMERMRWYIYGDGLLTRTSRGRLSKLTDEQRLEQKREHNREIGRKQRAALKIFRELGFSASKQDRSAIYQALKAELPSLNI